MKATVKIEGIDTYNHDYLHTLFSEHGFAGYSGITRDDLCTYSFIADEKNQDFHALIAAMVLAGFTVTCTGFQK